MDRVLDGAPQLGCSVSVVAHAWAAANGRTLVIQDAVLPAGVFGRWLSLPDRDVVQVGVGVVGRDRTIAHELGHMVLGHRGQSVTEYAAGLVQEASADLVAYMLQRACCDDPTAQPGELHRDEVAAEWFAGLLTRRVGAARRGSAEFGCALDDALG